MLPSLLNVFFFAASALSDGLETTVSRNHANQRVLEHFENPSNFIASSIFGRRLLESQPSEEPEFFPPRFSARNSDADYPFEGMGTFAHLDYAECTKERFDIGIVGHPFDLGVSYRPGARFGPNGGRQGARRMSPDAGWE
jgi:agmatinase